MKRRAIKRKVEIRADGDESPKISGYAAVFFREDDSGTEYHIWDRYYERIHPEAFTRALEEQHDVRGLFNHDSGVVLGRTSSGTLRLMVDDIGLRYEIDPPESRADIVESIQRGDIDGSSFAFEILEETRTENTEEDRVTYEIRDLKLYDVGPVTFPAYASASTEVRSDPRFQDEPKDHRPANALALSRVREIQSKL